MALSVEDRMDIEELASRYNHTNDHEDAEGWASTFTENGALIVNGKPIRAGRKDLESHIEARRSAGTTKLRHWLCNLVVDGDGDRARLRAYVMAFRISDGLGAPFVMGEYDDELEKIGGKWLFSTRRMTVVAGQSSTGR